MPSVLAPPPNEIAVDNTQNPPQFFPATKVYRQWLLAMIKRLETSAAVLRTVALPTQTGAIGSTNLPLGPVAGGLYRVTWFIRITQPAGVSSSVALSMAATDDGVTYTQTGPAVTGNTTSSAASGVFLVSADPGTPITYATAYSSSGAPAMTYKLELVCELVG